MPDENREALQTILAFLNEFADISNENQVLKFANFPRITRHNVKS